MRIASPSHILRSLGALFIACFLGLNPQASPSTVAGDGEIVAGKLNLLVYFTYPEADPGAWQPVFEEYSKLLLNATQGGLQLGRVQFTSCSALSSEADVWVLDDNSGARAHIGGLGRSGQHITISQTHRSSSGFALGQFGLAHETGHYVWSLYDEYLGFINGFPGVSSSHYCSSTTGSVGCLMDGGTTVFPNNQRTEFCTDVSAGFANTIHNDGQIDAQGRLVLSNQEYVYSASCWRQIESNGAAGLAHPSADPSDVTLVHEDVEFDFERYYGTLAMGLLIDTSGSMSGRGRIEGAIVGSSLALGMLRDGESQAVYGFDDNLRTIVGPQTVTPQRRASAIDKVAELQAAGGTQAGLALADVAQEMANLDGCRRFLILLTDGISSQPDVNDDDVIQALLAAEVQVYPVALGNFTDDSALIDLANLTGGQFYQAATAQDVPAVFAQIFALAGGGSTVAAVNGPGSAQGLFTALSFDVAPQSQQLVVALAADRSADPLLEITGPRGKAYSSDAPPPEVDLVQAGDVLLLRIPNPATGSWSVAYATRADVSDQITLHAAVESNTLSITTSVGTAQLAARGIAHLEASVVFGVPVAGASVQGTVTGPDGYSTRVTLHDDGHPASGDLQAGDGVYSTLYSEFQAAGVHRLDLQVVNLNGVAASNRECGIFGASGPPGVLKEQREQGTEETAVDPFRARAEHSFLVLDGDGLPTPGSAELHSGRATSEAGELSFALAIGAEEALRLERFEMTCAGDVELLEGYELHLDVDLDGALDRPRRPMGRVRIAGSRLLLERTAGDLALLPAGDVVGFVLAPTQTPRRDQATGHSAGTVQDLGPGLPPFRPLPPILLLLGLALLLAPLARRAGRGQRRIALGLSSIAACAVLAALPACHSRTEPESLAVGLDPVDLVLSGAATGASVQVAGDPIMLRVSP